jgi:hypothetical protein
VVAARAATIIKTALLVMLTLVVVVAVGVGIILHFKLLVLGEVV